VTADSRKTIHRKGGKVNNGENAQMAEEAERQGDRGIGIVDDATMRHNKPVGAKGKCTIPKWNALF